MGGLRQDPQQQRQRFNARAETRSDGQILGRYTGGTNRSSTHPQQQASQLLNQQHQQEPESDDGTVDHFPASHVYDYNSHVQSRIKYAEELEKTEQSITLALQEIDRNFAQAQRIVASAIVPVVERYGQESRKVWAGARFWKGFFEASANVNLAGYEEIAVNEGAVEEATQQQPDEGVAVQYNDESLETVQSDLSEDHERDNENVGEDSFVDNNRNDGNNDKNDKREKVGKDSVFNNTISAGVASRHKDDSSMLPDPPSTLLFAPQSQQHLRHGNNAPTAGVFKQPVLPHTRLDFGSTPHIDSNSAATAAPGRDDTVSSVASSPFNSNILPQDESPSFAGVSGATPARYNNNTNNSNYINNLSPVLARQKALDTTWRIQTTPHKKAFTASQRNISNTRVAATIQTPHRIRGFREQIEAKKQSFAARFDSSPLDQLEPPQLQFDLSSPTPRKKHHTDAAAAATDAGPATYATPKRRGASSGLNRDNTITVTGPKTPIQRFYEEAAAAGDSSFESDDGTVGTPSNPPRVATTPINAAEAATSATTNNTENPTAFAHNTTFQDDDTSLAGLPEGMSPPVTMQFTMPTNVLQHTPAREAAQTIVQDILRDSGAGADDLDLEKP